MSPLSNWGRLPIFSISRPAINGVKISPGSGEKAMVLFSVRGRTGEMLDMKKFGSPCFGRFTLQSLPGLLAGMAFCLSTTASLVAADATNMAAQISGAPVFYQNLRVVGPAPSAEENFALWVVIEQMKIHGAETNLAALEQFMTNYPSCSWVPSLRANLGRCYRDHGRYTRALYHWEAAWNATRYAQNGPAKEVADFTFA